MKQLILLAVLLPVLATFSWAQTIHIQSRIIDVNGNGVAGVEITETASCASAVPPGFASASKQYVSDGNGNFRWPQLSPPGAGSQCAVTLVYQFGLKKEGFTFPIGSFGYRPGPAISPSNPAYDTRLPLIYATDAPGWVGVSAASFEKNRGLASEMIVAGFGIGLSDRTETAAAVSQALLPTTLANRRIVFRDNNGVEKPARLSFVSPAQINYVAPEALAGGPAVIKLLDGNNTLIRAEFNTIGGISPGIFSANADGKGVPAGLVVRVYPGNVQVYEPIAMYDEAQKRQVPLPLDLGPPEQFLVLAIFGTGWRQVTSLADVQVRIGGVPCQVEYAGKQPTYDGLDQINVRLPRDLIGRGVIDAHVIIKGVAANPMILNFK